MAAFIFLIFCAGVSIGLIVSMFVDSYYPSLTEDMLQYEDMAKRRRRARIKVDVKNNNQNTCMANVTKVDVTFDDGSVQSVVAGTPPVAPSETEVDVLMSDGTTRKFVPAA